VILTPNILARLAGIVVVGALLQLSFFSQVTLFHVSLNMLPALVVVLGLLGGTMTGAVAGFSIGFLVDCLLIAPLGRSSLVLLGVGYLAGMFRERFEIHSWLVVPLLCGALTLAAELGAGAVAVILGLDTSISGLVVRDILLKSLYAFLLGWPLYAGLKRLLRPALVDDLEARRSRRPTVLGTSGGVS
jgi:rod shape-determining protein MreD